MSMVAMILTFVTAIVLGPLLIIFTFVHLQRRTMNKREVQAIRDEMSRLRADIEDMKEQIADVIIRTS